MLNFSKNNEKLQLLIESGLINDDDSLKKLIDGRIEEKQALLEGSMNNEDK